MGDRAHGGPPSPGRRRLLIVLGYAGANIAAISRLRRGGNSTTSAGAGPDKSTTSTTAPGDPPVSTPPALDGAAAAPAAGHTFDIVIANGRVMDPESGFDRVAHVGIDGATVADISLTPLTGRKTIDAANRVVAPGFIDLLSYEPNDYGVWYKVGDGITTNLGCHGLNARSSTFMAQYAGKVPVHFGGAYDNPWMRGQGWLQISPSHAATTAQIDQLVTDVAKQIDDGWIGVDFEPEYTPGITFDEMKAQAEVAAAKGVPCFFHGRYSDMTPPGTNVDTLNEILGIADATGASVHVEHITSTGGTFSMPQSLKTLADAKGRGVDVSACMYPYDFWATYLGSPRFDEGWQERFRITYSDLEIPGTGERLTAQTFAKYRAQNKLCAAFAIPDADVVTGMQSHMVMLGSDAILEPGNNNHPRSTGCMSRALGRFVREQKVLSLMDCLAKMTIMPAHRLEHRAPALRKKGRLQRGADADITIFDPATVADASTVENPAQYSVGIDTVIVLGQVVKDASGINHDVRPGQAVTYGV